MAKLKQIVKEKEINIILKKLNGKRKTEIYKWKFKRTWCNFSNSGFKKDLPAQKELL